MATQTLLYDYDAGSRYKSQRERILGLFRKKGYCYTQELIMAGIYQYNARIKELRGLGYHIISERINGRCGFRCFP